MTRHTMYWLQAQAVHGVVESFYSCGTWNRSRKLSLSFLYVKVSGVVERSIGKQGRMNMGSRSRIKSVTLKVEVRRDFLDFVLFYFTSMLGLIEGLRDDRDTSLP